MKQAAFDMEEALLDHWKRYSYLGYRDLFSTGYSIDFFRSRLLTEKLDELGMSHPDLSTYGFTSDELAVIQLLREFVWFRNYRTERFFEALYMLEPLWEKISLDYQLGEHDLFYYLVTEVSALFLHGKTVAEAELTLRKEGSALLLDDNRFLLLTGDLLKKKEADIRENDIPFSSEVKGMVVCRGVCRGPVVIVHNDGELDKVKEGDVLVTGMTTPDYLPALRKAAAFVTDEGGVTCHAAIVARELKKPCIVGTKRATQVLKEGQMVEVDANAGIVRII
jgi:phosphohistidine swiveling domain-containing protein